MSQRLLGEVWVLGDVADVENLARRALAASKLRFDDPDDALCSVFECVVKAWPKWNPAKASASTYLYGVCRFGFIDYQRKTYGRTKWSFAGGRVHERKLPELVSFDGDVAVRARLEQTLTARASDSSPGCDPALEGLLGHRAGTRDQDFKALGLGPPRRAA